MNGFATCFCLGGYNGTNCEGKYWPADKLSPLYQFGVYFAIIRDIIYFVWVWIASSNGISPNVLLINLFILFWDCNAFYAYMGSWNP